MATMKRKAISDERPNKKVKSTKSRDTEAKPTKSTKIDKSTNSQIDNSANERRPVSRSILQQEEKAFPRGGASILTPIEQRQIKAQAERDVLFEQQTGQPVSKDEATGELFDDPATATPRPKKRKTKRQSELDITKPSGSGFKVQGLSYKNLIVGSTVLGYVTAITERDIALALPNNLTGYVPLTEVSGILNARIDKLLAESEAQAHEGEEKDVELKQLFHAGQWLRATVTATGTEQTENSKSKRHITLSLDPQRVNGGLDAESIVTHSMLQASVRSIEDHGVIMDLGLSDQTVKGFVSKKELGSAYQMSRIEEGQVMMCLVTGKSSNSKVFKLSPDAARFSALSTEKNAPLVNEAPIVDAFLPGTAINVLVIETTGGGVVGKVMGMLDVTADLVHSGAVGEDVNLSKKVKVGTKIKGRIIFALPCDDGSRRLGISLLEHLLTLPPTSSGLPENANTKQRSEAAEFETHLPLSSIIEAATITRVLAERGVFLTLLPTSGDHEHPLTAFAHISQISDNHIDSLSPSKGPYQIGATHRSRVIAYNPVDNIYYVSLKQSILQQTFLRLEDVSVGGIVRGTVDRLIVGGKSGITGVLVKLSDSVTGLVPEVHLSDAHLQHPERKFREGLSVKARVLSVDLDKRHLRLTLKKSVLDQSVESIWKNYIGLKPGMEGKGTIVSLLSNGAAVQFFGNVRAWLPVAEMSETFIEDPRQHFRLGQTVDVHIVSIDAATDEMKVSCKGNKEFDDQRQEAWEKVAGGKLVSGTVTVASGDSVAVELEDGLSGLIRPGHLADGSFSKSESALRRMRAGQKLSELVVLDKLERSRHVLLSRKPSFVNAARIGTLIRSLPDVKEGMTVQGFVRNITKEGIYVEFANRTVGLVPRSHIPPEMAEQEAYGLRNDQTVQPWVLRVDSMRQRFTLSMREQKDGSASHHEQRSAETSRVLNPADPSIASIADFTLGKVTKARIASTKSTQINVRLADNVQGRIDISETFNSWDEITNKKAPLQKFQPGEELAVKILGIHDARNHRFLPISHRQSSVPVFELSAKKIRLDHGSEEILSMDTVKPDTSYLAFLNNHGENCVWVNLSPNVRGRVALMDLSDDVGMLQQPEKNFPIGSALRVTVKTIDVSTNRLDLRAEMGIEQTPLTIHDISPGMILPGRITKISERSVNVQLTDSLAGPVSLVELSDDYDRVNLDQYNKNDIVRVCALDVDLPNKKVFLSMRPSKVLSSSLPVKDTQITSITQLKPGDVVRGFVKHIADKGVLVSLGARVDAFVRIADLSDQFIKDWKTIVEIDQLVKGRILAVDVDAKHISLSLKAAHVEENYKRPISITDLEVGMTITGKVRKVEDFGAFIDIDNTMPRLSGLCHRSEVAAKRVQDVRKLYSEGDIVKAKILNVDTEARKISLGLKASYFQDDADEEEEEEEDGVDGGIEVDGFDASIGGDDDSSTDMNGGVDVADIEDLESEGSAIVADEDHTNNEPLTEPVEGLKTSGFDWSGDNGARVTNSALSDSEPEISFTKKRKRTKSEIKVDLTGDLDKYGPRSVSDFERQLLGQPNDSGLWIQYMAFQLQLSEVQKARDIAERALRTIHIRESEEKANIWIAWLNLEVEYGDEEKVEETFKQACQLQDPLEMHEKLASIYIDSGKHDKADAVFEKVAGNKAFRASPKMWLNYATFLMGTRKEPARARALLSRALQSIATGEHRLLTAKFGGLEFHSNSGDPERGRTIFEGLLAEWPKWSSGWDMWVDLERSRATHADSGEGKEEARAKASALYERMVAQKMKKRRAKQVFKRWLEFEEQWGDEKRVERVKALAKKYVETLQAKSAEDSGK